MYYLFLKRVLEFVSLSYETSIETTPILNWKREALCVFVRELFLIKDCV